MPHVREVMTSDVLSIESTAPVLDALRMMSAADVRHLPVIDGGVIQGMVSDRDLAPFHSGAWTDDISGTTARERLAVPVAEYMNKHVERIFADADLDSAAKVMIEQKVGALPVVDGSQKVIGMLSYIDIIGWARGKGLLR